MMTFDDSVCQKFFCRKEFYDKISVQNRKKTIGKLFRISKNKKVQFKKLDSIVKYEKKKSFTCETNLGVFL